MEKLSDVEHERFRLEHDLEVTEERQFNSFVLPSMSSSSSLLQSISPTNSLSSSSSISDIPLSQRGRSHSYSHPSTGPTSFQLPTNPGTIPSQSPSQSPRESPIGSPETSPKWVWLYLFYWLIDSLIIITNSHFFFS